MDKYLINQYKILHNEKDNYGSAASSFKYYFKDILELIRSNDLKKILDFGCGKGVLVKKLNSQNVNCIGYDPAVENFKSFPSDIDDFDLVVSTDVFEHLNENCMTEEFDLIKSCNPKFLYFNIATNTAVNKLPNGINCHTIVKKHSWWEEKITTEFSNFTITKKELLQGGAPSVVFVLKTKNL